MISRITTTDQVDDARAAVDELLDGLDAAGLGANSVGILYCYSDMELEPFLQELERRVPFDVVGCTCIASMDNVDGFHVISASLLVLSADDCTFGAAMSAAVTPENVPACVQDVYTRATEGMEQPPKLLYAIPPYDLNIMLDAFTDSLNAVAPGIPVVGGLPSYNATGDHNRTILGARAEADAMVLLAIGGNVRPVFEIQNVTAGAVERKRRVTQAENNTVYRVGNQTFTEYMREVGFPLDSLTGNNDTITYVSNPLLLENVSLEGGDDFSFVRTLHKVDLEQGSGTAIGMIPMGATLSICPLQKSDIAMAAGVGMRALAERMREAAADGYRYTTVLAVSCIGRHLLMLPDADTETVQLLGALPDGLTLAGFYGYGEIGPQPIAQGNVRNFALNESLVLCAF